MRQDNNLIEKYVDEYNLVIKSQKQKVIELYEQRTGKKYQDLVQKETTPLNLEDVINKNAIIKEEHIDTKKDIINNQENGKEEIKEQDINTNQTDKEQDMIHKDINIKQSDKEEIKEEQSNEEQSNEKPSKEEQRNESGKQEINESGKQEINETNTTIDIPEINQSENKINPTINTSPSDNDEKIKKKRLQRLGYFNFVNQKNNVFVTHYKDDISHLIHHQFQVSERTHQIRRKYNLDDCNFLQLMIMLDLIFRKESTSLDIDEIVNEYQITDCVFYTNFLKQSLDDNIDDVVFKYRFVKRELITSNLKLNDTTLMKMDLTHKEFRSLKNEEKIRYSPPVVIMQNHVAVLEHNLYQVLKTDITSFFDVIFSGVPQFFSSVRNDVDVPLFDQLKEVPMSYDLALSLPIQPGSFF